MDRLGISRWTKIYHTWKSLRGVPFRRKWFVGYDLEGNTYWEFRLARNLPIRRAVEYRNKKQKLCEYTASNVPPRWMQWLRFTRSDRPSLDELIQEEARIQRIKALAAMADAKWKQVNEISAQDQRDFNDKIRAVRGIVENGNTKHAPKVLIQEDSPIEMAHVQPRPKHD